MSWSYNPTLPNNRYKVRALIGDTDSADQLVTDEFIDFALDEHGDNVTLAASYCCHAIAAKLSKEVDVQVESVSSRRSQKAQAYHELAFKLERKAASSNLTSAIPFAGGISVSENRDNRADTDRMKERFYTRQFENDGNTNELTEGA